MQNQPLGNLCITPCGLWSAGLGRSTSLFFLPIALLLAAKRRLVAHPEPTATASPELCRGSLSCRLRPPEQHNPRHAGNRTTGGADPAFKLSACGVGRHHPKLASVLPPACRALDEHRKGRGLGCKQRTDRTCARAFATQHDIRCLGAELLTQTGGDDDAMARGQTRHHTSAKLCMNLASRVVAAWFECHFGFLKSGTEHQATSMSAVVLKPDRSGPGSSLWSRP